ncbi:TPA: non-canonical purine NTP pyrophosphatase [Stenotrophomonas maltophilia]|uniref:non-canonical purine NTP pyrophosphatase n=2 Tax=Stenotrophomonas maltophilia TaxID=40324 RepID=UPI00066CC852|nr:non-canonical purine NTP pyrophosphatase [Stenotrophomonas maltophilia]MBH1677187.1 non-canonical purine NTP pyrophosphatase [Stenotrophomonas maltophilia]MDZ5779564.1 non-canonical purine NTP pyrophosphatase [Stenotrophomonas maltophilia]HDS1621894.1 non-canonical purine NTP pyrophosphatase [Stenotrophomonas maltophilia]HEL3198278.1 non-canonical purine NTP pyrophosphatase [Stenotrophomonas maltophilia]HEL3213710.1 non-canonical purine NTP pyrophosphatase [Stenotrophomonas maltophilia]
MKIRFMSGNDHKINEVQRILGPVGVEIVPVSRKIEELQTQDVEALVRDKLIKAFQDIGRPLFVEHTGLYLRGLNGLPAGLTQIFWDRLEARRFADLVAALPDDRVIAKTMLGYCDGREMYLFEGAVEGTIPRAPAGPEDFQWDCVFIPEGHTKTFAEMGAEKDDVSMRRIALDRFAAHLRTAKGTA